MIVTNREAWARRARYLTTQAKDDPVEFVHREIGYNYRLPNILAAVGCSQMEILDKYICIKRHIASQYIAEFKQIEAITPMREAPWAHSIFWMFTVLVDKEKYGMDSRSLLKELEQQGIQARPLWQPIHLSPAYAACWNPPCPVSEKLNQTALSLPCSVGLTPEQQERVIQTVKESSVR